MVGQCCEGDYFPVEGSGTTPLVDAPVGVTADAEDSFTGVRLAIIRPVSRGVSVLAIAAGKTIGRKIPSLAL